MDKKITKFGVLAIFLFFLNAGVAFADVFTITSQLTGDTRPENPDNIILDLNIDVVDTLSTWTLTLDQTNYPGSHLKDFGFNLDVSTDDVTFANFDPSTWSVTINANNVPGSGGADFDFLAGTGQTTVLSFTALLTENWTMAMFTGAEMSMSNDSELGEFQLGAHVGGITTDDLSGYATGNYNAVPIPPALLLLGTGLAGLFGTRIRRKK